MIISSKIQRMAQLFILFVILSSGCIQKETGNSQENSVVKRSIDNCSPTEKTVIIRLDDVQDWWSGADIALIDASLDRDVPIVLAVIPKNINNVTFKNYLVNKSRDQRVEIAQHGTNHVPDEYQKLNGSYTYYLAKLGLEKIVRELKVHPVTFIPPNNEYNENTSDALSKLGFKIISSGEGEYRFDKNMAYIGYTVDGYKITNKILDSCSKSMEEKNVCVIMLHPRNYTKEKFVELLDGLRSLNVKFSTFKDLTNCVK